MNGLHTPSARLVRARAGLVGALLAGALALASIAIVVFLVIHAAPLPRPTRPAWIPAPQHAEKALAKLEQPEDHP